MRKRSILVLVAALALLIGGSAIAAAATSTSTTASVTSTKVSPLADVFGCPSGYAWFWKNADMGGEMGKVAGNNPNFRNLASSTCSGGTWNDCVSSIDNNGTQCTVYWFSNANYGGTEHSLSIGDWIDDLGSADSAPVG